ncbi:hypothetical protein [Flagellimonas sp. 2504JD1-5]
MNISFETYEPRKILPEGLILVNDWYFKVYTISNKSNFGSYAILENVKSNFPEWTSMMDKSDLPSYKQAFVIVHEAREGVWILLNWWTGGEMVQTKVYFSDFEEPGQIKNSPYETNALLCVWELEIFAHERRAWIQNVLLKAHSPDFETYGKDMLVGIA